MLCEADIQIVCQRDMRAELWVESGNICLLAAGASLRVIDIYSQTPARNGPVPNQFPNTDC